MLCVEAAFNHHVLNLKVLNQLYETKRKQTIKHNTEYVSVTFIILLSF